MIETFISNFKNMNKTITKKTLTSCPAAVLAKWANMEQKHMLIN